MPKPKTKIPGSPSPVENAYLDGVKTVVNKIGRLRADIDAIVADIEKGKA